MKAEDIFYKFLDRNSREREVLRAIEKTGSLSQAADALGVSYKTVWNYVVRINNAFGRKVVETKTGGERGGGACLTELGKELLKLFDDLSDRLGKLMGLDEESLMRIAKRYTVRTSARNQLSGKVVKVRKGVVNAQVDVRIKEGEVLSAVLTMDSLEALGIKEGMEVLLLIKAPWVIVSVDDDLRLGARNVLSATVKEVIRGAVNSEVILETEKGTQLVSVVTNESADALDLKRGKKVKAIFKSSHVILGV